MAPSIGIVLFDGVEELDWAGPYEVLTMWSKYWPDDGASVFTLAREAGPVTCAKGMVVLPHHTWESAPPIDVLVYPGGEGTRPQLGDEVYRGFVREHASRGTLMTSVCTGSLVYADAGLLDGGRPPRTGDRSTSRRHSVATSRCAPMTGGSTAATSSPRPASPPASTWPCTSSPASRRSSERARCAAISSTTPNRRSSYHGGNSRFPP